MMELNERVILSNSNATLIYQLICGCRMKKYLENPFVRSPTLDTVLMVERTVEKHSGEYARTALWKNLPRKVMWQTFLVILDYLQSINKIALDTEGKIAYIWNPDLAKMLRRRRASRT